MSKGSVYLDIQGIVRVISIWDEVLRKLRVSIDGLITRKKVFLDSSHHIETYLDVFVEGLDIQISVSFELSLDEYFIEFW